MFTLTRRESSPIPLDVTGILPETVANLSALEVAKLPVLFGNRTEELGQLFDVKPGRRFDLQVSCLLSWVTSWRDGAGAVTVHWQPAGALTWPGIETTLWSNTSAPDVKAPENIRPHDVASVCKVMSAPASTLPYQSA